MKTGVFLLRIRNETVEFLDVVVDMA